MQCKILKSFKYYAKGGVLKTACAGTVVPDIPESCVVGLEAEGFVIAMPESCAAAAKPARRGRPPKKKE